MIRRPRWLGLRRTGDSIWIVGGTLAALGSTAVAACALLLHEIATPWQWTIVLTAFSHQLMWAAPVGVLMAVLARRAATAVVAAGATVLVAVVQLLPLDRNLAGTSGPEIVVVQANLHVGEADPAALTALVRSRHVDLLATEELTPEAEQRLVVAGLATLLPHRYTAPQAGGSGIGVWSRFPLRESRNLPGYELGVLTTRVAAPDMPLEFVAVHLLPPYPYSVGTWRTEVAHLKTMLHGLPAQRVLVAGDFNATIDHAQYRALATDGYADAMDDAGAGYLPTYPTDRWWGPVIGIDHVLVRRFVGESAQTCNLPGSDHRALLVRVVLPG